MITSAFRSTAPTPSTSRRAATWLHKLPEGLSFTQGALVEPFSVAYNATVCRRRDRCEPTSSRSLGGGPIGLLCVDGRRREQRGSVVLLEPQAARRDKALEVGARRRSIQAPADFAETGVARRREDVGSMS